ncbi:glutathione S-transferase family protein [Sphingobium aquiterrae]|uniref:glutathione S-transferase family protein n=1 Tax=Sphingobium aquiterrae TaxID=2038656 RepID=UPI003016D932
MGYILITANRNYSSWSLRPWVLMTVLGIAFEDRVEPFLDSVNYDRFRAFSPTGTVPVLIDGDRTLWDSLGIVLYLADRHQGVWPADERARAWAQCAVAEMHAGFSALRNDCPMNIGVRVETHAHAAALRKDIARLDELWGEGLARFGGPFLAGDRFSAVDAFFAPVAFRVRTYGLALGAAAQGWVDQMLALPAMQAWEKAGLAETWREPAHEQEMGAAGRIVADYRAE